MCFSLQENENMDSVGRSYLCLLIMIWILFCCIALVTCWCCFAQGVIFSASEKGGGGVERYRGWVRSTMPSKRQQTLNVIWRCTFDPRYINIHRNMSGIFFFLNVQIKTVFASLLNLLFCWAYLILYVNIPLFPALMLCCWNRSSVRLSLSWIAWVWSPSLTDHYKGRCHSELNDLPQHTYTVVKKQRGPRDCGANLGDAVKGSLGLLLRLPGLTSFLPAMVTFAPQRSDKFEQEWAP